MKTKDIILCAIFASITSILAQISIPIPFTTIPLTMQIFSVALTGMVLGSKKGFISIMIYLILGAIGMPVFAQMSGGIGILILLYRLIQMVVHKLINFDILKI